jgi:antitoxin (DNA-binding transcriptional repressor) of toxin-antitoxin stability system
LYFNTNRILNDKLAPLFFQIQAFPQNGEEVVFTQNNLLIAKLVTVRQEKPRPQFGSAKGLFVMAEDFNEPLEDFDEYFRVE